MASLRELEPWLYPYARWFVDYLAHIGERPRVTSTFRSYDVQAMLYRRYQLGKTIYPVAPPGTSWHEYRRAFDLVVVHPELAGELWRRMGGSWWPADPIHFEG